jgi:phosphotriesterase-related protein
MARACAFLASAYSPRAACASKASGTPVTTHTYAADRVGEKQADIFESEGLNPQMVCLGHCDDSDDMHYLVGLARRGYTLGMDHMTWGSDEVTAIDAKIMSWQRRAENMKRLIDAGYGKQLFLSNDWYFGIAIAPTGSMAKKKELNPDGLLFTTRKTVPYLRKLAVSEQAIRQLTIENPKRFFGGEAAS